MVSLAGHDHFVPLAWLLRHILGGADGAYDTTMIMVPHLVVCFAVGVEDLALDPRFHGVLWVSDAEIDAAVTAFGILVFDLENEVLVLLFGGKVGIVALPAFFSGTRMNQKGTVLLRDPIARRFPTGQVLAVVKGDETVLVLFMMLAENGQSQQGRSKESEYCFLHDLNGASGSLLLDDANLNVAPSYAVGTASFSDSVNLQTDESLGVRLQLFLVHEVGYLFAIDPSLDTGSFG